jgi:hypothetical protein
MYSTAKIRKRILANCSLEGMRDMRGISGMGGYEKTRYDLGII